MIKTVEAAGVAPAVGPYCHATVLNGMVYCSGSLGIDANTRLVSDDVATQTHQALKNLATVLGQAGSNLESVVKTTVFITNMADYTSVNEAYAQAFGTHTPARSCIAVAALPLGALVEVEAIAKVCD